MLLEEKHIRRAGPARYEADGEHEMQVAHEMFNFPHRDTQRSAGERLRRRRLACPREVPVGKYECVVPAALCESLVVGDPFVCHLCSVLKHAGWCGWRSKCGVGTTLTAKSTVLLLYLIAPTCVLLRGSWTKARLVAHDAIFRRIMQNQVFVCRHLCRACFVAFAVLGNHDQDVSVNPCGM